MKKYILTMILMALLNSLVQAAPIGTQFSYQGQLLENGVEVNGSYTFQFILYTSLTGSLDIAIMPSISGVAVNQGLFNVDLDFGDIPFDGDDTFLEIRVKEDSQVNMSILSPRQRINTVPYAIQSAFVENSSSPWQEITGGIGYTNDVKIGNLGTTTSSLLTVDAVDSPLRMKVGGSTKMIINSNGGTSIGANTSAPDNGLRVEGISRLVGDIDLRGDLQQEVENNGAIKAGVYLFCSNNPSITNSFNGVNSSAITTSVGADPGKCRINFPFVLDNRFFMAMYRSGSTALAERRLVTCSQAAPGSSSLDCAVSNSSGTAVDSNINVMVY